MSLTLKNLTVEDNLRIATYALGKKAAAEGRDQALDLFPQLKERRGVATRSPARPPS